MHEIDRLRRLSGLNEKYTDSNIDLRDYLRDDKFDPHSCWDTVCEWLENEDLLEEISDLLGHEVSDADELSGESPDVFFELPETVQKECSEWCVSYLMQDDPAEAPTTAHMHLRDDKLLHRLTWLVHFTDHLDDIQKNGFTRGVWDMDRLGLTKYAADHEKADGGYNFGFLAASRDAIWAASQHKYGRKAVIFQNSGVHAYHYGDEEDQIIFWGADVSAGSIIALVPDDGDWVVQSRVRTRRGDYVLFRGEYEAAVHWIMQNHQQYRSMLYKR